MVARDIVLSAEIFAAFRRRANRVAQGPVCPAPPGVPQDRYSTCPGFSFPLAPGDTHSAATASEAPENRAAPPRPESAATS